MTKPSVQFPSPSLPAQPKDVVRRLAHWRAEYLARQALKVAGEPGLVLDLPSGDGRFWPVLAEHANRVVLAADDDHAMMALAESNCPGDLLKRVNTFKTSAFAIDLTDNAVDCIFSMRLFHRLPNDDDRRQALREFHRVSRDTVIVSLWVDGNLKSWRRKQRKDEAGPHSRLVISRSRAEEEFRRAGFRVLQHYDLLPGLAMWRVYVLRKNG